MALSTLEWLARNRLKLLHKDSKFEYWIKPDWLKNPETGRNLEIDIFETLPNWNQIWWELQWDQHFIEKSKLETCSQPKKDAIKKKICSKLKIKLNQLTSKWLLEFIKKSKLYKDYNKYFNKIEDIKKEKEWLKLKVTKCFENIKLKKNIDKNKKDVESIKAKVEKLNKTQEELKKILEAPDYKSMKELIVVMSWYIKKAKEGWSIWAKKEKPSVRVNKNYYFNSKK